MKNFTKQVTKQAVLCLRHGPHTTGRMHKPPWRFEVMRSSFSTRTAKAFLAATALTGVLAMADLGAVQAGDSASVWRTMRPLYATSFDVGRKHVLSYFLSKNGLCDLTVLVTDRPDETPEGDEIPTLSTARFAAAVDGGKTARLDTADGRSLEYACATGAQAMRITEVTRVAITSRRPQRRINATLKAGLGG